MILSRDGVMALVFSLGVHGVFLWPAAGTQSAVDPFDSGRNAVSVRFAPSMDSSAQRSAPVREEWREAHVDLVNTAASAEPRVETAKPAARSLVEQAPRLPTSSAESSSMSDAAEVAKTDAVEAAEVEGRPEDPGVTAQSEMLGVCRPSYPRLSRKLGEEGTVTLEVEIGSDGRTREARLLQTSGHKRLDASAMQALGQALFQPARRSGTPVKSLRSFAFTFALEDRHP